MSAKRVILPGAQRAHFGPLGPKTREKPEKTPRKVRNRAETPKKKKCESSPPNLNKKPFSPQSWKSARLFRAENKPSRQTETDSSKSRQFVSGWTNFHRGGFKIARNSALAGSVRRPAWGSAELWGRAFWAALIRAFLSYAAAPSASSTLKDFSALIYLERPTLRGSDIIRLRDAHIY